MKKKIKKTKCIDIIVVLISFLGIAIGAISLLIASQSLDISDQALDISENARQDIRDIERLDLKPTINFQAQFNKEENSDDLPNFIIGNWGSVEVVLLEIQLIRYIYNDLDKTIPRGSVSDIEHWSIEELQPFDEQKKLVSEQFLTRKFPDGSSKCQEPFYGIIEAFIKYRRNPDRKLFIQRVFYFLDNEALWITEKDALEKDEELYSEIIDKLSKILIQPYKPSDILHDVDIEQFIKEQ